MKITDLLYSATVTSEKPITKVYIIEELTRIGNKLLQNEKLTSGEEMTKKYHKELDELIEENWTKNEDQKNNLQCYKGCSTCCSSFVMITDLEANILKDYCKTNDIDIDENLISKQVSRTRENWNEIDSDDRKCMFLDEKGACKVYDVRPGVCRKHLVISDSAKCGVLGQLKIKDRVNNLNVELLTSAMWQIRKIGSMAKMISIQLKF